MKRNLVHPPVQPLAVHDKLVVSHVKPIKAASVPAAVVIEPMKEYCLLNLLSRNRMISSVAIST
jgi:hypothetical protein